MPCLELPYADGQGSPDTIGSIGEGSWSGGCGEGAVTRAEVLFLCPSRGATSQTPAMSRTLLLLLLLLRGLAAGRPPPAATPRLKLSFPGEHGTRAGWGGVGSGVGALVMCQQHPASSRGTGVSWGAAWWEGCKTPALARPQHCCRPPRGLSGVGTACHVPYLMPAPPGPPACPWGHACAQDLTPSHRRVPAQVPLSLRAPWWHSLATAVPYLVGMSCQPESWCHVPTGHSMGFSTAQGALSSGGSQQELSSQPDKGLFVPATVGLAPRGREWPLLPCCLPPEEQERCRDGCRGAWELMLGGLEMSLRGPRDGCGDGWG